MNNPKLHIAHFLGDIINIPKNHPNILFHAVQQVILYPASFINIKEKDVMYLRRKGFSIVFLLAISRKIQDILPVEGSLLLKAGEKQRNLFSTLHRRFDLFYLQQLEGEDNACRVTEVMESSFKYMEKLEKCAWGVINS